MTRRGPDGRRRVAGDRDRGVRLDPVTVQTADGHTWDGMLLIPASGGVSARRRLLVIVVHGSVGNYASGVPRRVAQGLADHGFTALSVNTRMANFGAFFGAGLLHRTPLDLDAWVDLGRRLGHARIVLLGYSLGATMVTAYQAGRGRDEVAGVCTLAHAGSLPDSLRRRWERWGADPDYATVAARAAAMLDGTFDDDAGPDEIFIVERASGPTREPVHAEIWSYRTWWHSRGPHARHGVSAAWVGDLRVPLAIIQAADDAIVTPDDGKRLAATAHAGGVPDVRLDAVPGANHVFSGREHVLVDGCVDWLSTVVLA